MFNRRRHSMPEQNIMPMMDNYGCGCDREIIEPVISKCVEREFYHEVPQE